MQISLGFQNKICFQNGDYHDKKDRFIHAFVEWE